MAIKIIKFVRPLPEVGFTRNVIFLNHKVFHEFGLEFQELVTGPGEAVVQALLSGAGSYAQALSATLPAAVQGRGLKFVASFSTTGVELFARSDIDTLKDLEGKSISGGSPMWQHYLLYALRQAGVDPASVSFRPGDIKEVLNGSIAAIALQPPATAAAIKAGLKCVFRYGAVAPIPVNGLVTTDQHLQENPDEVKTVLQALIQSVDEFMAQRERGIQLVKHIGTLPELVELAYDLTRSYMTPVGVLPEAVQREWVENAKRLANVDELVPLSRVFDFSLVRSLR